MSGVVKQILTPDVQGPINRLAGFCERPTGAISTLPAIRRNKSVLRSMLDGIFVRKWKLVLVYDWLSIAYWWDQEGYLTKLKMALLCSRVQIFFHESLLNVIRQRNIYNLLQLIEILLVSRFLLISFFFGSVMHGVRESQLAMHFTSTAWHILFVTQ